MTKLTGAIMHSTDVLAPNKGLINCVQCYDFQILQLLQAVYIHSAITAWYICNFNLQTNDKGFMFLYKKEVVYSVGCEN